MERKTRTARRKRRGRRKARASRIIPIEKLRTYILHFVFSSV
jgi:hypothetical protein